MDFYKRFSDENYKNWLQVAESLYILRTHIREFVENETETYHRSLREQLPNTTCQSKCVFNKRTPRHKKGFAQFQLCDDCTQWKDLILQNHNSKGIDIPWSNCQPHLWPTDKWEVAKVYMLRGIKDHHSFDKFDISSILNFMSHCKHFKAFTDGKYLNKVLNVRNRVMHSPDLRLTKDDMVDSIKDVQELAKTLENHAPGLKTILKEIEQFKSNLEIFSGQVSQNTGDNNKESQKLINREVHALKEKIEFLSQRYEDQSTELKIQEELQGMKNFLDQNKDLLENLGPQVHQLNEIQEKVNKHEEDISKLNDRVDRLEVAPDPVFSVDELKFKNHVFEEARKRNMPEPEFTEECEANGYRGIANVNGRTFRGSKVCKKKVHAHQEVAKIALEYMKSHPEWKEEPTESTSSTSSSTSSSNSIHYGMVTVVLTNQEVISDAFVREDEATESAYRKLACQFGLTSLEAGNSFRTGVLEYFQRYNFPKPLEGSVRQDDKTLCKLLLSGSFTFYDKDGSSKKKQAEHQAAKVALQHLSGIFDLRPLDNVGDNYKGFLKEALDALRLAQPVYDYTIKKVCIGQEIEEPTTSEHDNSHSAKVISKNDGLHAKNDVTVIQDLPTADTVSAVECKETETLDSRPPEVPNQAPKVDSTSPIYYGTVTVFLSHQEVVSDGCVQEEEATESAYKKLAHQMSLTSLEGKTAVLEHFGRCNFPPPVELLQCEDDKVFCKLQLIGAFTFFEKDGSSKKKQAEQQAAEVALKHLSGLFNCSYEAEAGKNYKVFLKESLDALHLKSPVYTCKLKRGVSEEMEGPVEGACGDNLHSSGMTAISKRLCLEPKDSVTEEHLVTETQDTNPPDIPNKSANYADTEISTLLALFHLKPPSVTVEDVSPEKIFSCHVDINLDKFLFKNTSEYNSKKDAIRKTYLLLGNALGINKTELVESNASMLVKQDFSQKSLTHPNEVFEDKKCTLTDITYNLVYDGKGSSESEAKLCAMQKAIETLSLLSGFKSLPKSSTPEEMEDQINTLLKTIGQKQLSYSHERILYKSSVQVVFQNYTMESKHKKSKKENLNHLSERILGLLAVEPEQNTVSLRNCLDDWFKRKNLKQPVFENTEEALGSKVTFSVKFSCSNPNWEDNLKVAEEKLVSELRKRLTCLTDLG